MFDLLLAAEESTGVSTSTIGWIVGSIITALTTGGGAKLFWSWWVNKDKERRAAWAKVVSDKDAIIAKKDAQIAELSTKLSKKSDQHAEKIEELMGMTLDKVEGWSGKIEGILDRSHAVQADFTAQVRKMNLEPGSDLGGG